MTTRLSGWVDVWAWTVDDMREVVEAYRDKCPHHKLTKVGMARQYVVIGMTMREGLRKTSKFITTGCSQNTAAFTSYL